MSNTELTRQQLDPARTLGAFAPTVVLATIAAGWAVSITLISAANRATPVLDGVTLIIIALVAALFVRAADPLRAPFSMIAHLLIHAAILAAFALHAAASWGDPNEYPGGWAPYTLGAMMLAIGPYRPARELVVFGTASVVAIAAVVFLKDAVTAGASFAAAVGAVTPALACCYASARYSGGVVGRLIVGRAKSVRDAARLVDELRGGISRAVRDDRVTILDRDVTPFFADIIARGEVTNEDRNRARGIAQSFREVMVADANRSWLQVAIASLAGPRRQRFTVVDPNFVATAATSHQRMALRAFLVALDGDPQIESMILRLNKDAGHPVGVLTVHSTETTSAMRSRYDPFFAVMQMEFPEFAVDARRHALIVRFGFDHS